MSQVTLRLSHVSLGRKTSEEVSVLAKQGGGQVHGWKRMKRIPEGSIASSVIEDLWPRCEAKCFCGTIWLSTQNLSW